MGMFGITIIFSDDYDNRGFGAVISAFILIPFILILIHLQQPTAIDVYEGKTTLEITYKNGVPVDSTVVWKSK